VKQENEGGGRNHDDFRGRVGGGEAHKQGVGGGRAKLGGYLDAHRGSWGSHSGRVSASSSVGSTGMKERVKLRENHFFYITGQRSTIPAQREWDSGSTVLRARREMYEVKHPTGRQVTVEDEWRTGLGGGESIPSVEGLRIFHERRGRGQMDHGDWDLTNRYQGPWWIETNLSYPENAIKGLYPVDIWDKRAFKENGGGEETRQREHARLAFIQKNSEESLNLPCHKKEKQRKEGAPRRTMGGGSS